jgi:hypothetical protein
LVRWPLPASTSCSFLDMVTLVNVLGRGESSQELQLKLLNVQFERLEVARNFHC